MKNGFIIDRVGERYYTNQGYEIEIIRYNGYYDISVKFLSSGHVVETTYTSIKNGTIKNLLHKTVKGVGCFGYGEYKSRNKIYDTWFHILTRCYCEKTHIKQPTYIGCSVDDYWHNYQKFAEWVDVEYTKKGIKIDNKMYLDKDLLVKNNKIYSKDTCVFIPNDVNVLITNRRNFRGCLPIGVTTSKNRNKYRSQINIYGKRIGLGYFDTPFDAFNAYKEAKENHIKDIANKYKNEPWMLDKLYNALMTYEVEITD